MDCERRVFIAYKDFKRVGGFATWVLHLDKLAHSNEVPSDPLDYESHQQRQSAYAKALF